MATNTPHPITLAEFLYVGKVTPTFRNAMLKGRECMAQPEMVG